MTIGDFYWSVFWNTFHYVSWYEIGALSCFTLAWLGSIFGMLKTGLADGKGLGFTWLTILGCVLGVCYKLFCNLDVLVFGYLAVAFLAMLNLILSGRLRRKAAVAERRAELMKRGGFAESGSHGRHHHRRHHSHGSHERREGHADGRSSERGEERTSSETNE